MSSGPASDPGPSEAVSLRVHSAAVIDPARALVVLRDPSWLGRPVGQEPDRPGIRRVVTDLELPVLDGSGASPIRKAGYIDLGEPRVTNGTVEVEVSWHSATFSPLFPVFAGRLDIGPDRVVLEGWYVPPFGKLGLVLDRGLLHLVARRTGSSLLARLVRQMTR